MSPLFSEPSSGSLLHFQEKKKVKVLTLTCSVPHGLSLASLLELSSLLIWLHSLLPLCGFLNVPNLRGCSGIFLSLGCPFPLYGLTLCSLLTNHLQINVFKIVPPPGPQKLYPDPSPLHILLTLFYFSF